ncbi:zinc-binding metallopeptidase family protein [Rhodoplanes sp. Z2-YC6860]|uniref:zinc-binding metallopeptidase family protein n=1 Tax=Rhodoplanes sp. Z2-YC6860 TaxID=674703 RepID=UPI00078B6D87|nr:putative zinc-binding peptidase [Rhodoplanes sp. Z2-YC6860]AMN45317.1 hypothetical protein RHPLAN_69110 [Rhodoplanes sp. Z2-YC6860]
MKLFECQKCNQLLHFENTRCESCGSQLGYLRSLETLSVVEPDGETWRAMAEPEKRYRFCANAQYGVCNWMVDDVRPSDYCSACRHNQTVPDLSVPENIVPWRKIEFAKHRLIYTLLKLRLPLATKAEDPDGLAFDFLHPKAPSPDGSTVPVMTGHADGVITINLAEADDAQRERIRTEMSEPYRTLLGHFRHEIGHYYWDRLIGDTDNLEKFRAVFGDERLDYAEALKQNYENGPPANWQESFVTTYASCHPWEDFAETWAHYFHMVDTLETARSFGLSVRPRVANGGDLTAKFDFDPHKAEIGPIVDAWVSLTVAANSLNRSMGLPDLYPFVLAPAIVAKLTFVHDCIRAVPRQKHHAPQAPAPDRSKFFGGIARRIFAKVQA